MTHLSQAVMFCLRHIKPDKLLSCFSSKKGNKMKKAVSQVKNGLPGPGQDKDTVTAVQKVSDKHIRKCKCFKCIDRHEECKWCSIVFK